MARDYLTDDQVEKEIERLTQSREVRLVRQEQRLKYKKRQYLYQLRNMESVVKNFLQVELMKQF